MKEITICLNEGQGAVSADIYGQFIEHLGDCVYGGVYEKNEKLSDENNIRLDVLEKVKELAPPIIRFPGSMVMCIYHSFGTSLVYRKDIVFFYGLCVRIVNFSTLDIRVLNIMDK